MCVDDKFPTPLAKHYVNLPVKGKTHTIRAVFVGREVMHPKAGNVDVEIGLHAHAILSQMAVNEKETRLSGKLIGI
ncbi:MAG: hypothetical protein ACREIC_19180, partial [Limisphaerales bacterium]